MLNQRRWMVAVGVAVLALGAALVGTLRGDEPNAGEEKKPSLKDEMRQPWQRDTDGYIRDWVVLGPLPNPPAKLDKEIVGRLTQHKVGQGFDTDFLKSLGGEAKATLTAETSIKLKDGTTVKAKAINADRDIIDLKDTFAPAHGDDVVGYAYTTVESDRDTKAYLALGSDDSVKVWLNGKLVHEHRVGRAAFKDEDIVPIELKEGDNALLLKVENVKGGWAYVVRTMTPGQVAALPVSELQPTVELSQDGKTVMLTTDTGYGTLRPNITFVTVEAIEPGGGKVLVARKVERGEKVELEAVTFEKGVPYEFVLSFDHPEGYRSYSYLPFMHGWKPPTLALLTKFDTKKINPRNPVTAHWLVLQDWVRDRLGEDVVKTLREQGEAAELSDALWRSIHPALMEAAELRDRDAVRPHGFVRLKWTDPVDDSPQFCRAYLPPDYDANAKKRWPLVVNLHGYNPRNPDYIHWWSVMDRHDHMASRHNVIVIHPHGRGNTGYHGIGDQDVRRAIEHAKQQFNVDDDRVYLMGYSMGGGGTWHVGTRHPHLFAGLGPIYGGWDYKQWMDEDELAKLTPHQRLTSEMWSSFAYAEALNNMPVFINHGDDDQLVDVKHSRYATRMLQRWGYNVRYWEHPKKGHGRLDCEDEMMRHFMKYPRNSMPRHVRIRASRLEYAEAYWVKVQRREDPWQFIKVDCRAIDDVTIRLDTENATMVTLSPDPKLIKASRSLRVIWNGRQAKNVVYEGGIVTLRAEKAARRRLVKSPGMEGPIGWVQTTPFMIVAGTTSSDPMMKQLCTMRAEQRASDWEQWQKVRPRFRRDVDVSDEMIKQYTLILYGGPEANAVTKKLIDRLPLTIEPNKIVISGLCVDVKDGALAMVYPNPLNPERYVVIIAGNSPAGMYFTNRLDDECDFVVADAALAPWGSDIPGEKVNVAMGRFDTNWRSDSAYTLMGDAEVRAKAPRRIAPRYLDADVKGDELHLGELMSKETSGSFKYLLRDKNFQGEPIVMGGKKSKRGISVQVWHEPCFGTWDISKGNWKRLRATIGIELRKKVDELEDKEKMGTNVMFVVEGDGKELYRSKPFGIEDGPREMEVDIAGVKLLTLRVENGSTWHNASDSVNWGDVRLVK